MKKFQYELPELFQNYLQELHKELSKESLQKFLEQSQKEFSEKSQKELFEESLMLRWEESRISLAGIPKRTLLQMIFLMNWNEELLGKRELLAVNTQEKPTKSSKS